MDRAGLAARLALAPLLVIAIGFFMPPIVRELREQAMSPFEADGWRALLWPPIHLTALVLAAITVIGAYRRTAPGTAALVVALVGIVACGSLLGVEVGAIGFEGGLGTAFTLGSLALLGATVAIVWVALRRAAWQRWVGVLAAYAIAIACYGCPRYFFMFNVFSGGVVFIVADATLLVLALRAIGPRAA